MTNIQDAEMFWGAEATKIDWETDGQEVDLPKSVKVPDDLDSDEIADYLSDKHGFLVNSFQIKDAESFEANVEEHSCSECGEEGSEGVCGCYLDNMHGIYMVSIRANNCPFCKTKGFELGTPCNSCGANFRKTKDSEGNMRWKEDTQTMLEMAYDGESFELHDWYDDMSDYGVMEMHPRIKEQKDEYLENQKNQSQVSKDEFPDNYFMKDSSESLHDRRLRNIDRAVGKSNNLVSPIESRMPISVRTRMPELPSLPTNSKYLKYAAILAIASVVGYKVASK